MSEDQHKPARLEDVLNYEADKHISSDEMAWIRSTFKENPKAINTLRKLFMPYAKDLPIEEMTNDIWFRGGVEWASLPNEEVKALVVARQDTIKWIMNGFVQLKMIANMPAESPDEAERRRNKDSAK